MKFACQLILVALQISAFFCCLHRDIYGKAAKPPLGFQGVVTSVIALVIAFYIFLGAGALSELRAW